MPGEPAAAVHAEALKLRRSRVPWATAGAMVLLGLVGAFFMFVLQDVGRARSMGMLGSKAQLTGGTADWPGYFSLAAQAVSVGGLIVFGTAAIWLFGREFSDRTATDLLALPAVGVLFLTVLAAQVLAALGHGAWFPWAVPALLAGTAGPEQVGTGRTGPAVVVLVTAASSAATAAWWERADHAGWRIGTRHGRTQVIDASSKFGHPGGATTHRGRPHRRTPHDQEDLSWPSTPSGSTTRCSSSPTSSAP